MTSATTPHTSAGWRHRLSVAPMMDWTDRHCRVFHRLLAPDALLYTEMVHAEAVIHGDREHLIGFSPEEHPLALQLGGSEPDKLTRAAVVAAEWGYDEVNLNVGCPSDRVQAGRFGACLMREPDTVARCVGAMQQAVDIPVTVKCRLGVDEQEDYVDLLAFIDRVAAAGCRLFVVHARKAWLQGLSPKENREVPPLRYELVYRLKQERPDLTILINGGITDAAAVEEHLQHVDGVMIGRAAYHEPYFLHQLQQQLFRPGSDPVPREELLLQLRPYVEAQLALGVKLKHISRHLLGLFHAQPGGRNFRRLLTEGSVDGDADWSVVEAALAVTRRRQEAA